MTKYSDLELFTTLLLRAFVGTVEYAHYAGDN